MAEFFIRVNSRLFCLLRLAFASLREILSFLLQRLINEIGEPLEQAVFVVWEVLSENEQD